MKKDWETKKLGEVVTVQSGTGFPNRHQGKVGNPIPFYKVSDMNLPGNERQMIHVNNSITEEVRCELRAFLFPKGSTIFPKIGGAIATNKKRLITRACCVDNNVMGVIPKHGKIESEFLFYFFLAHDLSEFANQAHLPSIKKTIIQEWPISIPQLSEQRRIVGVLDEAFADLAIIQGNAQKNFQSARALFESHLQSVFTQRHKSWLARKIGDQSLLEIIDGDRGLNYPKSSDFAEFGHCLFLNTKNVRPEGFNFESKMFISADKDKQLRKGKLVRGDVVLTTRGTIGNIGLYSRDVPFEHVRINSGMLIFRPKPEAILSEYLFELLRSEIVKGQIRKHTTGAAQPQLPIKTLVNFEIPVPKSIAEQRAIVMKLRYVHPETQRLARLYKQKLAALAALKKSLLHQAFTGEL